MTFYSIAILIIKTVIGQEISLNEIVKSIFAPIYNVYWFPTAYIGMYFCFPLLNIIVDKVGEKLIKALVLLTVIFSLLNFLFPGSDFLYSDLSWFLYLYLWGAYIKRNDLQILEKKACLVTGISVICIWLSSVFFNFAGIYLGNTSIVKYAYYFSGITSPFVLISGLGVFIIFKNLKIETNKCINYLGSISFSVYLLHDNPFFREILWKDIFATEKLYDINVFILSGHMLFVVVILFGASALIEVVRKKLERIVFSRKLVKQYMDKLDNWFEEIVTETKLN